MDLLAREASAELRARWLEPLVRGEISSAFCMTEPAPGAGSDPANLRTRAHKDGVDWVIDGHKWYATGGGSASVLLVMARTDEASGPATLFAVPRDAVGVEHVRDVPTMAEPLLAHREAELRFHGVRVREEAVIGEVGQGFVLAQKRLVPARLTHCMRWLGLADRALEMCKKQLETRRSFGKVADAVHGLHAGNLMTLHCAWMLEEGKTREARGYSSMCKNHVARLLCDVLDDAIQIHGGLGFSDDMPFAQWYRHARAARIADGPEEVHDVVVARDWISGRLTTLI
jgi:acyl-CoA dehydrogenase